MTSVPCLAAVMFFFATTIHLPRERSTGSLVDANQRRGEAKVVDRLLNLLYISHIQTLCQDLFFST